MHKLLDTLNYIAYWYSLRACTWEMYILDALVLSARSGQDLKIRYIVEYRDIFRKSSSSKLYVGTQCTDGTDSCLYLRR